MSVADFDSLTDASIDSRGVIQKVCFHLGARGCRQVGLQIVKKILFAMDGQRLDTSCVKQADPSFHFVNFIRRGTGGRFLMDDI